MSYDNWKTTNPDDDTLGSAKQRSPHRHEPGNLTHDDRPINRTHRHELPPGECVACDADRGQMHPSHDASFNCESGKRAHCSCDACF